MRVKSGKVEHFLIIKRNVLCIYGTLFKTNFLWNNNNKILPQMICLVILYFLLLVFLKVGIYLHAGCRGYEHRHIDCSLELDLLVLQFRLSHLLVTWPWASNLASPCFSFLICKMESITDNYLIGLLWGLNGLVFVKHSEWCWVHSPRVLIA